MRASIQKKLVIKGPRQFYKFLKDKQNIVNENKQLVKFRDAMFIHITGCNCSDNRYYKQAEKIYRDLNLDDQTSESLKNSADCSKIELQIAGVKIYQI